MIIRMSSAADLVGFVLRVAPSLSQKRILVAATTNLQIKTMSDSLRSKLSWSDSHHAVEKISVRWGNTSVDFSLFGPGVINGYDYIFLLDQSGTH